MPTNHQYAETADYGQGVRSPGLVGVLAVALGIALGIGLTQFYLQHDVSRQLAEIRQEIQATHKPLGQLTGFKDTAHRANSLLGRLEAQSGLLVEAGQTVAKSDALVDEIARLSAKLTSAQAAADEMQRLEANLQRQTAALERATAKLASTEGRVRQLEALALRLQQGAPRIEEANHSLVALERLREEIINQQCLLPELNATVDSHKKLGDSIRELAGQSDVTSRAIATLAANQAQVQALAIGTEETNLVLSDMQHLVEQHGVLQPQVNLLADTLDEASALSYQSLHLNTRLRDLQQKTSAASKSLDEMAWVCDYLSSQDEKIAASQKNLKQIDTLQKQVAELGEVVPAMVENIDLVKGLNRTMVAILGSSASLRAQLAEIVLMQPAVEQLATQFRSLTAPEPKGELVDVKTKARQMIAPKAKPEIPVYISRAK